MIFLTKLVTFVFIITALAGAKGYKILGVFPFAVKSHDIFCQSVTKSLAKRGHQVDVIVTRELETPPANYTVLYNMMELIPNTVFIDLKIEEFVSAFSRDPVKYSSQKGNFLCDLLTNEKMQKIIQQLKAKSDYDLFITEAFTLNCFMGLAHFLNIPVIIVSPQTLQPWVEDAVGNPTSAAIYPNIMSSMLEINSFWDRLQSTIEKHMMTYKFYYYTDQIQTELIRKYISADLPSVRELSKSSILTISNTHFTFNGIKPTTPAVIQVAGLHVLQDEAKFTPQLQKWMDESVNGVVYFSLGTVLRIDSLPRKTIFAFFSVIKRLKSMRFLIRAKNLNNLLPEMPENLKILSWVPQVPVLSHKNTKAFITHCGLLSSLEAIHFGVPIVGISVFMDQHFNCDQLVNKGMGIKLNRDNITETILFEAVTLVLNNSTYREAAKNASNLFKDRPMNAEDTTVYWIEYVLRNGGILKSPAIDLHWTQRELLDVYGILLLLAAFILYIIAKIVLMIVNFKIKAKARRIKEKKN